MQNTIFTWEAPPLPQTDDAPGVRLAFFEAYKKRWEDWRDFYNSVNDPAAAKHAQAQADFMETNATFYRGISE